MCERQNKQKQAICCGVCSSLIKARAEQHGDVEWACTDLDTHMHTRFLQVHVQTGNLGLGDLLGHAL